MPQPLLLLGTRMLAEEMFDLISDMPGWEVAGFVENLDRARVGTELEGRPIIWIDDVPRYAATHRGVCALSTTQRRRYMEQAADLGLRFATLVHPTARVSQRAQLGEGCFVSALAAIATGVMAAVARRRTRG